MKEYCFSCKYVVGPFKDVQDKLFCEECLKIGIHKLYPMNMALRLSIKDRGSRKLHWYEHPKFVKFLNLIFRVN